MGWRTKSRIHAMIAACHPLAKPLLSPFHLLVLDKSKLLRIWLCLDRKPRLGASGSIKPSNTANHLLNLTMRISQSPVSWFLPLFDRISTISIRFAAGQTILRMKSVIPKNRFDCWIGGEWSLKIASQGNLVTRFTWPYPQRSPSIRYLWSLLKI